MNDSKACASGAGSLGPGPNKGGCSSRMVWSNFRLEGGGCVVVGGVKGGVEVREEWDGSGGVGAMVTVGRAIGVMLREGGSISRTLDM